jgi:uncharacterized LabA/DUF88 family protein
LDYPKLASNITKKIENSILVETKYFTSKIKSPEPKRIRQNNYIELLEIRKNIKIFYGNYNEVEFKCSGCQRPNFIQNEKQTDVNIAVEMLSDAYQNKFDVAVIMSGDSDLVPPIKAIRRLFPEKHILACFPPKRTSKEIKSVTNGQIHIHESDLKNSQLPNEVVRNDGYKYIRPKNWK